MSVYFQNELPVIAAVDTTAPIKTRWKHGFRKRILPLIKVIVILLAIVIVAVAVEAGRNKGKTQDNVTMATPLFP